MDSAETQDFGQLIKTAKDLCFRYGMKPAEFWKLQPFETREFVKASIERDKTNFKIHLHQRIVAAWHVAAWNRTKRMPKFSEVAAMLKGGRKKKQTAKQMLDIAKMITLGLGGKIPEGIGTGEPDPDKMKEGES